MRLGYVTGFNDWGYVLSVLGSNCLSATMGTKAVRLRYITLHAVYGGCALCEDILKDFTLLLITWCMKI